MTKRKPITDGMKWRALLPLVLCSWCGIRFVRDESVEWDHYQPIALGGKHEAANVRPLHPLCHSQKTHGHGPTTAGSDIGKISKERRIVRTQKFAVVKSMAGDSSRRQSDGVRNPEVVGSSPTAAPKPKWPKRKLQSRGFQQKERVVRFRGAAGKGMAR